MAERHCVIEWIGPDGKPTPDSNPAIGLVRRDAYRQVYPSAVNGCIEYTETEWFPICAEHAKALPMPHWTFRALP